MKRGWIAFFLFSLTAINYVDRLMPAPAAFVTTGMTMLVGGASALVLANRPIVVADPEEREAAAAE